MKADIQGRDDIELLINKFYDKVQQDDTIGYLFSEVANVNWEQHLPVMYDFWEQVLFQSGQYKGNPMVAHQRLHAQSPLTAEHFERWLALFKQNADELFEGEVTEQAKQRAESIATVMRLKLLYPGNGLQVGTKQDSQD